MHDGLRVIDADAHVVEPPDLWERYIDPEFRAQAPRGYGLVSLEVAGHRLPDLVGLGASAERFAEAERTRDWRQTVEARFASAARRGYDPASQIEAMDAEGIDMAVLYPTRGLFATAVSDLPPPLAGAICRAYNRWLAEFCSFRRTRLFGAALVSLHDPGRAAQEAAHAVQELGLRAVFVRPNPLHDRLLDHPDYDELFAEVARLDVPIVVHEATAPHLPQFGRDRYRRFVKLHMMCHPVEAMGACMDLILGGVLEKHPTLRCAFLESSAGWAPWWLERMDKHAANLDRLEGRALPHAPSEYFRRQCFVSADPDERGLGAVVEAFGEGGLVLGSDYPHSDSAYPTSVKGFVDLAPLPEASKRQILWDNPLRLYGLPEAGRR